MTIVAPAVMVHRKEQHTQLMQGSPMRKSHVRNPSPCAAIYVCLLQSDVDYLFILSLVVFRHNLPRRLVCRHGLASGRHAVFPSRYTRLVCPSPFTMSLEYPPGIHTGAGVVRQKIERLSSLIEEPHEPGTREEVLTRPSAIADTKERFVLWCGAVGIVQDPALENPLDRQLADAPELRDQVCHQLNELVEALNDCEFCLATCSGI